ncbi:MAG: pantoate--beta-alanine ligase [Actinomycetota bacterium]
MGRALGGAMIVCTTKSEVRAAIAEARRHRRSLGFVPTMGFLHRAHLELVRRANRENDAVVVSIFVNPLQFGPHEDLAAYPRDLDRDRALLEEARVAILFAPDVGEMYPAGPIETVIDVGRIGEVGEGRFRPGHFNGVATVCLKLFAIVGADCAYFGQKDAQQLAVIRQIVRDLDLAVEIVGCPTVREPDGLAMSSRNHYLDPVARRAAAVLPRALLAAADAARAGTRSAAALAAIVERIVEAEPGVALQYIEVADPGTFESLDEVRGPAVLALAAFVGEARLIDNVGLAPPEA